MARLSLNRLFLLTGLLAFGSSALAASTAAGTVITNQATALFEPPYPGEASSAVSNVVTTTVQAVCAASITPDGNTDASLLGGDVATFHYTVTNAGNQPFDLPVSGSVSGLSMPPALTLYLDANGNGQVDPGESPVDVLKLPADGTAKLIAVVTPAEGSQGDGLLTLVASCGDSGMTASATGHLSVDPPPTLRVAKSFDPVLVKPGSKTTVHVTVTNDSSYASHEVVLSDLLTGEIAQGLNFVPGSAAASEGTVEYTADGATWAASQPQQVLGVRVRVPAMAAGASVSLNFQMLPDDSADGKKILNTAQASTSGATSDGSATADVHYQPSVAIGPVGNPLATTGTPADSQSKVFAVVGQVVCFDHTVQNTGDVRDTFTVAVSNSQGAATTTLSGTDASALPNPFTLEPGETRTVRVCSTPTQTGPLDTLVTVSGARGSADTTTDLISDIENGLPELNKSFVATTKDVGGNTVTVADGAFVATGDTVTYTLSVHNPYQRPLNNVVVTDPVPAHADVVRASGGGVVSGAPGAQSVTWTLDTLSAGETRTYTIVTTVSPRSVDGENLSNVFHLTSTEFSTPLDSNEVKTPVWNASLTIQKTVSAQTVTYGDRVSYTVKLTNTSATTAINDALVTDTPASGLEYVAGSSERDGVALADPTITDKELHWNVGTLAPGGSVSLTYDMRVSTAATGDLVNSVMVSGTGAGGAARAVASGHAHATTKLDPLKFAPLADIIGTVFVDRNRNGLFEAGQDTPIEGARVILAGGRLALTDKAGRYHFANVPYGTQAVRLDPNSVPYHPLNLPQDGGQSGTRTIMLRGLTSADFPLAALQGDAGALRRTTLTVGDVTVEKAVYAEASGYKVTLRIMTPRPLPEFSLDDPLPGGATLKEGRNTLRTNLGAGETTLTYHFDWKGSAAAATTDPVIGWRY